MRSTTAVVLAMLAAAASSAPAPAPKPNIVFLLVDDLGHNDVGYNNRTASGAPSGRKIQSPNIDRLADAGIKLTTNYVQEMCTPTRAALMTGRYPFRYGMTAFTIGADEPWGIPLSEQFFPEMLQQHGYVTASFGKWHLGFFKETYTPWKRGFDVRSALLLRQLMFSCRSCSLLSSSCFR